MIGVPPTQQDGDTVVSAGGRLQTTSERGAGLRLLVSSIVNLIKAGSTARNLTLPDRDLLLRGVSGTQTNARLSKFDANGDKTDSQIADGVTGNVLTIGGAITAPRTQNAQDKPGTLALTETSDRHGFKNLPYNARVLIDQRGTLATPVNVPTTTSTYGPDGWAALKINATQVMTIGKVAVVNTPMVGSLYACKLNITTGAAFGVGTEYVVIQRKIEGNFFSRCNFGTAQAATIYYSFWAESTATGIFSVSLNTSVAGRSYVVQHTITAANTRQLFQGTIAGDTTGTWPTDTSACATFHICIGAAATFQTTAGSWQTGQYFGTSSNVNFAAAVNSFQVSDLYLGTEPIGTATSDFPHVPYDSELVRCYRYLEYLTVLPSFLSTDTAGTSRCQWWFKATKRAAPTITVGGGSAGSVTSFIDGAEIDRSATPVVLTTGTYASAEL